MVGACPAVWYTWEPLGGASSLTTSLMHDLSVASLSTPSLISLPPPLPPHPFFPATVRYQHAAILAACVLVMGDIPTTTTITRMVQLPATAAIEYVAACCITRTRTITKIVPGGLCPFPPKFNAYTNRLGFLCLAS